MSVEQALISVLPNMAGMIVIPLIMKIMEKRSNTRAAVRALLRDRLVQAYNQYLECGWMPIYTRENIEEMFLQYKALGGNGLIDGLMERMRKLPTR